MQRCLVIDFETNGRPCDAERPCGAFPTQVSVDAFDLETGEITHLYDSFIRGAETLSDWVVKNTPVTLKKLAKAPYSWEVAEALANLWRPGDIIVAHNVSFDLNALRKICPQWHPWLQGVVVDTMRSPWIKRDVGKPPRLLALCEHLGVPFEESKLHDATYDTHMLALCLQETRTRGLEWIAKQAPPPPKSYRFRWHGMEHGKGYLEAWRLLLHAELPRPTLLPYPGAASDARPIAEALATPEMEERATFMSTPLS